MLSGDDILKSIKKIKESSDLADALKRLNSIEDSTRVLNAIQKYDDVDEVVKLVNKYDDVDNLARYLESGRNLMDDFASIADDIIDISKKIFKWIPPKQYY